MGFRLDYDLQQHGWADVTVELDGQNHLLRVSYLSDALRDLLDAVWGLTNGALETSVFLEREPTVWRWVLRRDGDSVLVDVQELEGRSERGGVVIHGSVALAELAAEFVREGRRLLAEYGEDGYRERWVANDFPSASLERLAAWDAS